MCEVTVRTLNIEHTVMSMSGEYIIQKYYGVWGKNGLNRTFFGVEIFLFSSDDVYHMGGHRLLKKFGPIS